MTPAKLLTIVSSQFLADYETLTREQLTEKYPSLHLTGDDFRRAERMCTINSRTRIVKSTRLVPYAEDIYTLLYDWHNCFCLILPLERSYSEFQSFCARNKIPYLQWLNSSLHVPNPSETAHLPFEYTYHCIANDRWRQSATDGKYTWSTDSFLRPVITELIEEAVLTPYEIYQDVLRRYGYVAPTGEADIDPYFKQLYRRISDGVNALTV